MSANVGVLAYNQPAGSRPRSFVAKSAARLLLSLLVAEEISARVIRMFPPSHPAFGHMVTNFAGERPFIPEKLPPAEVGGCHFQAPAPDPESRVLRLVRLSWHRSLSPPPSAPYPLPVTGPDE